MRTLLAFIAIIGIAGCGDSNSSSDLGGAADMSASAADLSGAGDMTKIVPYNMPGTVFCYDTTCSTTSPKPICCDSRADGGFSDSCTATAQACLATDSTAKTFACGQAADCGSGMVCCGDIGTSNSGKKFFNSTTCAASCTSTQTQLCVTASECKTGTSCVGAAITGRDVGLCQ